MPVYVFIFPAVSQFTMLHGLRALERQFTGLGLAPSAAHSGALSQDSGKKNTIHTCDP